jgi:geranylgeranyl diphosphate synthase type I
MVMIANKTAALIGTAAALGALLGNSQQVDEYRHFGCELGLAFQIQDDILGIWGDEAITGKSAANDLLTRKKTLPVLYGLAHSPTLRTIYEAPEMDLSAAIKELDTIGAREYAQRQTHTHHQQSLAALARSGASGAAGEALHELVASLLDRQT